MAKSTCETIRLGSDPGRPGVDIRLVSNSHSLQATCAAMAATYYWALCRRAANGNGGTSSDGYTVEVWRV